MVGIAPATEESLKLVPLLALALLAPGRVRRFAVADWLLLGMASGMGFLLTEDMARQAARSPAAIYPPPHGEFTLSPLSGGQHRVFDGVLVENAGHHVHTALIAVCLGLAVAMW